MTNSKIHMYMLRVSTMTPGATTATTLTFPLQWLLIFCPFWSVHLPLSFEPAWDRGGEVLIFHDAQ